MILKSAKKTKSVRNNCSKATVTLHQSFQVQLYSELFVTTTNLPKTTEQIRAQKVKTKSDKP